MVKKLQSKTVGRASVCEEQGIDVRFYVVESTPNCCAADERY